MMKKECADCKKIFEYMPNPNFPDKRKYCDECGATRKAAYEGGKTVQPTTQKPIVQPSPVSVEKQGVIATTEGIGMVEHVFQSSYEFGPAGNRHTIKYFSVEELITKKKALEEAGFITEQL